jgi:hypothetical protein
MERFLILRSNKKKAAGVVIRSIANIIASCLGEGLSRELLISIRVYYRDELIISF